jgi:hypothetical protein
LINDLAASLVGAHAHDGGLGQHHAIGRVLLGMGIDPLGHGHGTLGILVPTINDMPAYSIAFRFPSDVIPV